MNNWKRSYRRSFYKGRNNDRFTRYFLASLIAVMLIAVIAALALLIKKPNEGDTSSGSPTTAGSTTAATTVATTATTTTTEATTTTTETASAETVNDSTKLFAVGDEYFADACFIGDSRTQGLQMYSAPKTAKFYAAKGMTVAGFFNTKAFENKTLTAEQMLKKNKFKKVYIMLGLNELGWDSETAFIKRYGDVVNSVKSSQPGAKIFIQSILPVSAKKSASHPSFNNPRIKKYNKMIYDMCVQNKLIYLNVAEAVQDKNGNLPDEATTDGIHMNKAYCNKWMTYLRTHTEVPPAGQTTVNNTVQSISTSNPTSNSTSKPENSTSASTPKSSTSTQK